MKTQEKKYFGQVKQGDIIYVVSHPVGRTCIRITRISSVRQYSSHALCISCKNRDNYYVSDNTTHYLCYNHAIYTTMEEALSAVKKRYVNILSPGGRKVRFYDTQNKIFIEVPWADNKSGKAGFYQRNSRVFAIVENEGKLNLMSDKLELLCDRWFNDFNLTNLKTGVIDGIITYEETRKETDKVSTLTFRQVEKIHLPDQTKLTKVCKKKVSKS